jgi:hypothetical protein
MGFSEWMSNSFGSGFMEAACDPCFKRLFRLAQHEASILFFNVNMSNAPGANYLIRPESRISNFWLQTSPNSENNLRKKKRSLGCNVAAKVKTERNLYSILFKKTQLKLIF